MAFCNIDDVVSLTKPSTPYNNDPVKPTKPTLTEVYRFIDQIYAQMRLRLVSAGYQLPIVDADDLKYLSMVNAFGAGSLAEEALAGANNSEINGIADDLWKKYTTELKYITDGTLELSTSSTTKVPRSLHTSFAADGSDPEISDNRPKFRRDDVY